MIYSNIWGVLIDIKKKHDFKLYLLANFTIKSSWETIYDVMNSGVFAELAGCQLLKSINNYRAMKDPEYKAFLAVIADMMKIRELEGKSINFNKYGKKECIKSNRTRNALNQNGT